MPPVGYRKRQRESPSPPPKTGRKAASKKAKPTLFQTADASPNKKGKATLEQNKKFLEEQDDGEDESSLSEAESDDFEDVPPAKRRKTAASTNGDAHEEEDEDEMDWEDAIPSASLSHATPGASKEEQEIGDISVSMTQDGSYIQPLVSAGLSKKGPSKRERTARIQTHQLHVQTLMWHNTVRNSWLNDKEVQKTLVDGLNEGVKKEVTRWREAMGMLTKEELVAKKKEAAAKAKGKKGKKGKEKSAGRDWNVEAEHLEQGVPNLSSGDPLLRLLKFLAAYWRKRFVVTAPGLRKQGYKSLQRLKNEIKDWQKDQKDAEEHGERIESLQDFRRLAKQCEGSRDVGGQLFVALLRGIGLETRMVANLQPGGFGWSQGEEAGEKKAKKKGEEKVEKVEESEDEKPTVKTGSSKKRANGKNSQPAKKATPTRRSSRGNKADPINLEDSDSSLSSAPSEADEVVDDDDDLSVIDVTPPTPKKRPTKKYDRDMTFPIYWTEVCSPVSHRYYPVDPIVLSTIANKDELSETFEPRGKKAEKAKQVMCYTVAFSSDGTAKDVTVRYLKKHQLPGKTKGVRWPAEKEPVYNRKGKVKRYEEYDWFRTLMSLYDRPEAKRTAADDLEDQTDLKPFKPAKETKVVEKESLQGYKQSADFVLEPHLRREEAILPGVEPIKHFLSGKGDKAVEHAVYNRSDIVVCKTVESWHKEGRAIKMGEQPLKYVPMRAVTLIRKREMEDAQRETGEKLKQGLYSQAQTDWIIPPPIENGVIPKNAFGNMDVYVPTMVPKGAVHLPLKGSAKICRKLQIDYAEACTGFEFGKQRAVPVLTGVVVAQENVAMVKDAWKAEQVEIKRKEDTKRTAAALHWWRKMLLGLRVLERMRTEYADLGGTEEQVNPFVRKAAREGRSVVKEDVEMVDDAGGGGFFPEGYDEEEVPQHASKKEPAESDQPDDGGGGFLVDDEENEAPGAGGGFLVEDDQDEVAQAPLKNHAPITPVSLQSLHKTTNGAGDSEPESEELSEAQPLKKTPVNSANTKKKRQPAAKATKTPNAKGKGKGKRKTVESSEDEESSLSDLTSEESEPEAADSDVSPTAPSRPSARVVLPSASASGQSRMQSNRDRNNAKKVTPVRSQYFKHSKDDEDEEEEEEEEDGDESEGEVVKPRQTTARTKGRR